MVENLKIIRAFLLEPDLQKSVPLNVCNCNVVFDMQLCNYSKPFQEGLWSSLIVGHGCHKLILLHFPSPVHHIHAIFLPSLHHDLVIHSEALWYLVEVSVGGSCSGL